MKQFWSSFFGAIAGVLAAGAVLVVFAAFVLGGLLASAVRGAEDAGTGAVASGGAVLSVDLRTPRLDQPSPTPFAFAEALSHTDLLLALERARTDSRIKAVFVRADSRSMAPGRAEEIRAALAALSQAAKPVIVHAQGFDGPGVAGYFAVSGADELWMQASASFYAAGYVSETVFFGDAIERSGAQAEVLRLYEYKNAADPLVNRDYSDAHREATLAWLGSLFDTAMAGAAEDRGLSPGALRAAVQSAPHSAEVALETGLVDRLGHVHEAVRSARDAAGGAALVEVGDYFRAAPGSRTGPVIALVGGEGPVETGEGATGFAAGAAIGSDSLTRAIDAAAGDAAVRAIILRIDSPGGSAVAADQIADAVVRARRAGKPVVVSMGAVAASGGYYIAAPADRIVANASTLTGSIGVVSGKLVLDGALRRVGVNLEPLSVGGEFATAFSPAAAWSESQRAALEAIAEDIYADFIAVVAEGRDLPPARVEALARGRVWTGAQALDHGLVDRVGGLQSAVEEARALIGVASDEPVRLRRFPAPRTPLEAFQELFGASAEGARAAARLNEILSLPEVQAALRERDRLGAAGMRLETADAERVAAD